MSWSWHEGYVNEPGECNELADLPRSLKKCGKPAVHFDPLLCQECYDQSYVKMQIEGTMPTVGTPNAPFPAKEDK